MLLILSLWMSLFSPHLDQVPVLHEGRFRPFGTLPKEQRELQNLALLPSTKAGNWLPLSAIEKANPTTYPNEVITKIRDASNLEKLSEALIEGYRFVEGTCYQQAKGKGLYYPSLGQLRAELFLYRWPFKWVVIGGYLLASLGFIFHKRKISWLLLIPTFALHTTVLALRCWILNRPPVSNMNETLLYVPWVLLIIGLLRSKQRAVIGSALTGSALLLFFLPAHQKFENVQAVLDSQYWLIVHVMLVVGSYGIFFLSGICGHIYLLQKQHSLEKVLIQTMYLGTALLMLGTILGGVWAAESWGRFWDWDPKESWAFISCGIYLFWIHAYRFKKISGRGLAIGAIIGLMAITFTWYGVNYLLGTGLHSYGFGNGGELFYVAYLLIEIIFLVSAPKIKNILYKKIED